MKFEKLNKQQIQLCEQAYPYRKDSYQSKNYEELYLKFCRETDYQDIDPEAFNTYVALFGRRTSGGKQFSSLNRSTGTVVHTRTTMIKGGDGLTKSVSEHVLSECSNLLRGDANER